MRPNTEIMTEIAHISSDLRCLSNNESARLKEELVAMYRDLSNLCKKNNLDLILVAGSALGAYRHQGFIPWDDDLDVGLRRDHYETLIKLLERGQLGNKYEFTCPSKNKDSKNVFLKIYRKDSKNIEIYDVHSPFPKGMYIDVFPIDYAMKPGWLSYYKSFVADVIGYISNSIVYFQYKHDEYKQFMSRTSSGKKSYYLRKVLGKICGIISHKHWVYLFDKFVSSSKESAYLTIAAGRKGYYGETLLAEKLFPSSKAMFEGLEVGVPNDIHSYLTNLYGDYMTLPPEEKRERHYVIDIEFPKE